MRAVLGAVGRPREAARELTEGRGRGVKEWARAPRGGINPLGTR